VELTTREKFRIAQEILGECADIAERQWQMNDVYHLEMTSGIIARLMNKVEDLYGPADPITSD
jgi:hypothetical protein